MRHAIWQAIFEANVHNDALFIGGDFNYIWSQLNKKRGKPFWMSQAVAELEDFLLTNDLHKLEFIGLRYTWINNKDGSSKIWVRLDCILINLVASYALGDAKVTHLARMALDHCPIFLKLVIPPFHP